ncbi:Rieske (2Fe-2S) protein [Sulfolobus acidocaldarius SUSAZ]|nr:Rieske (2Fe-2S) protein [Sulfolobus acidocaldarius SUSAZ]
MDRRTFLRLYLLVGAAIAVAPVIKPALDYVGYYYSELSSISKQYLVANNTDGLAGFPKYKVANIQQVQQQIKSSGCAVYFFPYPLTNEPCFLVDLQVLTGQQITEISNPYYGKYAGPLGQMQTIKGVGPNGTIFAFSDVCVHLGCQLPAQVIVSSEDQAGLYAKGADLHCPCHGSIYALKDGGVVVAGPAPRPLPIVILDYDSSTGDIYAVGTNAPYFSAGIPRTTPQDNLLYDPRYSYAVPNNPSCSNG